MRSYRSSMMLLAIVAILGASCGSTPSTPQADQPNPSDTPPDVEPIGGEPSGEEPTEAPPVMLPDAAPGADEEDIIGLIEMTKWDLWASGETTLRGINIHQRIIYEGWDDPEYYGPGPVGPVFVQEDFDRLAALGANYVNISHPGLFTVDAPFALDEGIQANLDNLLEMIARADMFAVISFRTGPGRSELTFWGVDEDDEMGQSLLNDSVWEDQSAQDAWAEMWRVTAERYKDNPVVVGYDLMVEPNSNGVFFDVWSPEEFYPAYADTTYDWNRFYPPLVAAIRAVDQDTPILVGGMSFSAVEWLPYLEPTEDPRTVYTFHQYAPMDYTHQEPDDAGNLPLTYPGEMDLNWDGEPDAFDAGWLESVLTPVDEFRSMHGDAPVAVNEYGVQRFEPGAAEYMDDLTAIFEARGFNYALWSWTCAQALSYGEQQEFEYRLGPDIDNLTEEVPSDLLDVITGYWAHNTLRPSGVRFVRSE